jgi:hypothetical protein
MLECLECGCSSDEQAKAGTAFLAEDPNGEESPFVGVFCPVCAASEFEYRPERAADTPERGTRPCRERGAIARAGGGGPSPPQRATATPVPHLE